MFEKLVESQKLGRVAWCLRWAVVKETVCCHFFVFSGVSDEYWNGTLYVVSRHSLEIICCLSGTPSYMPPEYCRFKQYDGCQGTVWQMGILLVDMLSPVFRAFEDISDTITKPPHVPKHLSPGNVFYVMISLTQRTTGASTPFLKSLTSPTHLRYLIN